MKVLANLASLWMTYDEWALKKLYLLLFNRPKSQQEAETCIYLILVVNFIIS